MLQSARRAHGCAGDESRCRRVLDQAAQHDVLLNVIRDAIQRSRAAHRLDLEMTSLENSI